MIVHPPSSYQDSSFSVSKFLFRIAIFKKVMPLYVHAGKGLNCMIFGLVPMRGVGYFTENWKMKFDDQQNVTEFQIYDLSSA